MIAAVKPHGQQLRESAAEQRRRLLGNENELQEFIKLFVPRRKTYISQLETDGERRDWKTVHHWLSDDDVVRHLLGNRTPSKNIKWVGVFSWEKTGRVIVDVDYRGDRDDFNWRCCKVEKVLSRLSVRDEHLLKIPSPSGGRHYYFFLRQKVDVDVIRCVLGMAGLQHAPGQHEIFPSTANGVRLPFGCVSGQGHDPDRWAQVTCDVVEGRIPRVDWNSCSKRAAAIWERPPPRWLVRSNPRRTAGHTDIGLPIDVANGVPRSKQTTLQTITSVEDAKKRLELGIQTEGTRCGVTNQIAWHLVFACNLDEQEAADFLVDWVYKTGRYTSKDVVVDRERKTRRVEAQTREIVAWYALRRSNGGRSTRRVATKQFAVSELDEISKGSLGVAKRLRCHQVRFGLNLLRLAKACGEFKSDRWEVRAATKEVLRKWKGCSGMRYKERLDAACRTKLVSVTKGAWHNPRGRGRARTFGIHVPAVSEEDETLTYDDALKYLVRRVEDGNAAPCDGPLIATKSDTEFRIVSLKGKHSVSSASERKRDSVVEGREITDRENPLAARPENDSDTISHRRSGLDSGVGAGIEEGCSESGHQGSRESGHLKPERQHSWSSGPALLEDSDSCTGDGPNDSGLRRSTAGREQPSASEAGCDCADKSRSGMRTEMEFECPKRSRRDLEACSTKCSSVSDAIQRLRDRAIEDGYDSPVFRRTIEIIEEVVDKPTCSRWEYELLLTDPSDLDDEDQRRRTFLILEHRQIRQPIMSSYRTRFTSSIIHGSAIHVLALR